jgi:cephalosporin hydroxylase
MESDAAMSSIPRELGDSYLKWYYDSLVWKNSFWHGIRTLKLPSDLWNYQEIIFERRIEWVIETGTRHGGSALFFAEALQARGARGKVISIDIDASSRQIQQHEKISFVIGDSTNPKVALEAISEIPLDRGPLFLILDSDHAKQHVLKELELWVPFLLNGDTLIVEDTVINGHPVRADFGPGPYEAVQEFLIKHPGALEHDSKRELKFGITMACQGYFTVHDQRPRQRHAEAGGDRQKPRKILRVV